MRAWGASGSEGARLWGLYGKWEHFCAPHCGALVSTAAGDSRCGPDPAATPRKKSTGWDLRKRAPVFTMRACFWPREVFSVRPPERRRGCGGRDEAPALAAGRSLSRSGLPGTGPGARAPPRPAPPRPHGGWRGARAPASRRRGWGGAVLRGRGWCRPAGAAGAARRNPT